MQPITEVEWSKLMQVAFGVDAEKQNPCPACHTEVVGMDGNSPECACAFRNELTGKYEYYDGREFSKFMDY